MTQNKKAATAAPFRHDGCYVTGVKPSKTSLSVSSRRVKLRPLAAWLLNPENRADFDVEEIIDTLNEVVVNPIEPEKIRNWMLGNGKPRGKELQALFQYYTFRHHHDAWRVDTKPKIDKKRRTKNEVQRNETH